MLQDLTKPQVEQALAWLANPDLWSVPHELKELSQVEWFLLNQLLENLLEERNHSRLQ